MSRTTMAQHREREELILAILRDAGTELPRSEVLHRLTRRIITPAQLEAGKTLSSETWYPIFGRLVDRGELTCRVAEVTIVHHRDYQCGKLSQVYRVAQSHTVVVYGLALQKDDTQ